MRDLQFYQDQLALLADVDGTLDAALEKQRQIEEFLNGRVPARLGRDRRAYDDMVYDLNEILRKMELQKIVDNYDALRDALTSEQAMDEELAHVDEIVELRARANSDAQRAAASAQRATTSDAGKRYRSAPREKVTVDLTVEPGQEVVRETKELAQAEVFVNGSRSTRYIGSGLAASKQVETLRALLNSGRPLTRVQRTTIQGMIRAFENIISKEYDIEGHRRERDTEDQETEVVEEVEVEVVRKDHIREKIAKRERIRELAEIRIRMIQIRTEQDNPDLSDDRRRELEEERVGLQRRTEELLGIEQANPSGIDIDAQKRKLDEAEREELAAIRDKVIKESQFEIDFSNDVIPVLQELLELENVPDIDFEAIYASEVDKRLEKFRKELEELLKEQEGNGMSDQEIEDRLKEIQKEIEDEYHFRAHQENGMEEHPDGDEYDKLLEEQRRLKEEQDRRKEQDKLKNLSDEEIEKRLQEIQEKIEAEYHFRAHQENGMEEHPDGDEYDKLLEEQRRLKAEQDRRKRDRKIQALKNKIKELEELDREKVKVKKIVKKKVRRKHPKIKPIPDKEKGPRPDPPKPKPKKKSPRHWVEIMADLQTESSGSVAMYFHNMSKIQPLRMGITIWAAPIKAALKGTGMLFGNGIAGVNRKKARMRENIRRLLEEHPEEFDILIAGLTETNMRQYKVNEAFLDVVQEFYEAREAPIKQQAIERDNAIRAAMSQENDTLSSLQEQLGDPNLTDERRFELQQQYVQHAIVYSTLDALHVQQYAIQMDVDKRLQDFERGKQSKSTRKMNIQGWYAGSFNPDNRELHRTEAEFRRVLREARDRGDAATVADMEREIDKLQRENTREVRLLQHTRFAGRAVISRGQHKVEEVHKRVSDADQTKGRELIATLLTGAAVANFFHRWQANQQMQQQVDDHLAQHNQDVRTGNAHNQQVQQEINGANAHNQQLQQQINSANAHNQQVQQQINSANAHNQQLQQQINSVNAHNQQVQQQINSAQGQVSAQDIRDAGVSEIHRNNAISYATRHEAEFVRDNTPGVGFNHGGSDDAIHAAQQGMTTSRVAAESGSMQDITREVAQSAQRAQQSASGVLPDVQPFTTIPGKGIFVNSEYVQNLQHLASGGTSSFELLEKLFKSVQQVGQPELVTGTVQDVSGTIQDVSGTVQTISGTIQDIPEIAGLTLQLPAGSFVNWLPLVASIVNVGHLEQQKAERTAAERDRQRRERQAEREQARNQDRDDEEHDEPHEDAHDEEHDDGHEEI